VSILVIHVPVLYLINVPLAQTMQYHIVFNQVILVPVILTTLRFLPNKFVDLLAITLVIHVLDPIQPNAVHALQTQFTIEH
jgi:hypothetical protein